MHEFLPEEKSMAKELGGEKKRKESSTQLLKLFSFLSKQLGTIHIRIGSPIFKDKIAQKDLRQTVQKLAISCYRSVGNGMSVTPTALLAMIIMDAPSGALSYKALLSKAREILSYCRRIGVPITSTLNEDHLEHTIQRALELLLRDKKIKSIQKNSLGKRFYVVENDRRVELLYFKNSIIHQFLIPFFINSILIKMMNHPLSTLDQLKYALKEHRDLLKYEFYLPEVGDIIRKSFDIFHHALGRRLNTLDEILHLSSDDLFKTAKSIHFFTATFNYVYESYYVGCLALKHLGEEPFSQQKFSKRPKPFTKSNTNMGDSSDLMKAIPSPFVKML